MHKDEYADLIPSYAIGALDGAELAELEAHRAEGCELCSRDLREYEEVAADIARAVPAAEPPAGLRDRLLEAVGGEGAPAARARSNAPVPLRRPKAPGRAAEPGVWLRSTGTLATAAALILAAGFAIVYLGWALNEAGQRLDAQIRIASQMRVQIEQQTAKIEQKDRELGIVKDPEVRVVSLAEAPPVGPGIDVLWHPRAKKGLLYARGMKPAPPGKTYELWLVAGSKPLRAATFDVGADGRAVVDVGEIAEGGAPDGFAVTLEDAGGSDTPHMPILMHGTYSGM